MPKLISQDEFEYMVMCGSTADAYVYGLGHVRWLPAMQASVQPAGIGSLQNGMYLQPKLEMDIDETSEDYFRAIADEIKNTITSGNQVWDPLSGYTKELAPNSSVDVSVSPLEMVTVTVRENGSSNTTTVHIDQLMEAFANPQIKPIHSPSTEIPITYNGETGKTWKDKIKDLDYHDYSNKARVWAGRAMGVQKPFQQSIDNLYLYSRTISSGGTKLVHPLDALRLPKWGWLGKYKGYYPTPRIGFEMTNSTIIKTATCLKWIGRGLGGAGVGLGLWDIRDNGLNWSNGLDTSMAVLALNSYTAPIATVYFTASFVTYIVTDKSLSEHVDDHMHDKTAIEQIGIITRYTTPIGAVVFGSGDILGINQNIR